MEIVGATLVAPLLRGFSKTIGKTPHASQLWHLNEFSVRFFLARDSKVQKLVD